MHTQPNLTQHSTMYCDSACDGMTLHRIARRVIHDTLASGMDGENPDYDELRARVYSAWAREMPEHKGNAIVRFLGEEEESVGGRFTGLRHV